MERYTKNKKFNEGIDSIPRLEKEFKNYAPSDILGSLMMSMQSTGSVKKLSNKTWIKLIDCYHDLYDLNYESE